MTRSTRSRTAWGIVTQRARRLQVGDELDFCRLQNRKVARGGPLQDAVHITGGKAELLAQVRAVGNEATGFDVLAALKRHG